MADAEITVVIEDGVVLGTVTDSKELAGTPVTVRDYTSIDVHTEDYDGEDENGPYTEGAWELTLP